MMHHPNFFHFAFLFELIIVCVRLCLILVCFCYINDFTDLPYILTYILVHHCYTGNTVRLEGYGYGIG